MLPSRPGLFVVIFSLLLASCGGGNLSTPSVNDYRNTPAPLQITPQSLCYRYGNGYRCPGGSSTTSNPCAINYTDEATADGLNNRIIIGAGEKVDITTTGLGITAVGDGTINYGLYTYAATLVAGPTAGYVAVQVGARGKTCSANELDFTVVAPTAVAYNSTSSEYHIQNQASIGYLSDVYLQPDGVSFRFLNFEEGQATFLANGAYVCQQGQQHGGGFQVAVGDEVPGLGSKVVRQDEAYSGSCSGPQNVVSFENVYIPLLYFSGGVQNRIGTSTKLQSATEDANQVLEMQKYPGSWSTALGATSVTDFVP